QLAAEQPDPGRGLPHARPVGRNRARLPARRETEIADHPGSGPDCPPRPDRDGAAGGRAGARACLAALARRQGRVAALGGGNVRPVSAYGITTSSRPAAGVGLNADVLIRSVLFVAVFLIVWVSLHPFSSLADPPSETTEAGNRANQIG